MLIFFSCLVGLLGALLIYASTKPDACHFSRSVHISAPPEKIFPLIDNPRAMNEWNPFVKSDPNIKLTYSGPPNGVGAANDFEGDSRVGAGRAEIVESAPPLSVIVALRMDRPMKCQNRVEFTIAPADGGADVTWAMTGKQPFLGKLFSVFVNTEIMVGDAFESGLADLKARAEA
ncbi:SRPBCC family protein [Methylocystis sp. IM3]|uniref:SRPBCC family protein n=1 Tax=unclassified Methylocystis TaxID=2625913 RepID=UPI0030F55A69